MRYLYEAIGARGLKSDPLAVWLPIALIAAMATYVMVLASLVPRRFFRSLSILLLGMAAMLAVVNFIFDDVGPRVSEMLTPFVVQLVSVGLTLAGARLLNLRIGRASDAGGASPTLQWQFPITDLLLLTTTLAIFLSVVLQFHFFWYQGNFRSHQFLWSIGLCLCLSSVATTWAALRRNSLMWSGMAILLAPSGALPAWDAQRSLVFEFYWYGILTAMHAGFLAIALIVLRLNGYALVRLAPAEHPAAE